MATTITLSHGQPQYNWAELIFQAFAHGTIASAGATDATLTYENYDNGNGDGPQTLVVTFTGTGIAVDEGGGVFTSGSFNDITVQLGAVSVAKIAYDAISGDFVDANALITAVGTNDPQQVQTALQALGYVDDTIVNGSDDADFFGGGPDFNLTINGGGGDDTLIGGDGADTINGGDGNDLIQGGWAGDDKIHGGDDFDTLSYNSEGGPNGIVADFTAVGEGTVTDTFGGTDTFDGIEDFRGSIHNDMITGSSGDNILNGDAGNDTIFGNGGNDNINGGDGNDSLTAGDGIVQGNYIQGSYITGGAGDDSMQGGNGDDSFRIGPGQDTVDGGGSYDSVQFDDENPGNRIDVIFSGVSSGTVTGTFDSSADAPDDTIDTTFTSIDQVRGSSGADTFTAASDAVADGDSTTFQLKVEDGNGGHNVDFRAFTVSGEAGDDLFDGGGENGNNSGHGSFLVTYHEEQDQGTHGNIGEVYGDDPGEKGVVINLGIGEFDTTGDVATATQQDEVTVAAGTALDTYGDTDTITGVHAFELTDTNDYFTAAGAHGQDDIEAGGGNDTIIGSLDRDWLHGGDGNDSLVGGGGRDDLDGGNGNDTLIGSSGTPNPNDSNDVQGTWFNGGRGNDSMVGNNGGDYFVGGSGHDTIIGGDSQDQIAYENDNNTDGHPGDPHAGDSVAVTFTVGQGSGTITGHYGAHWVPDVDAEDPDQEGAWVADDVNSSFTSIERFKGTAGADTITAAAGAFAGDFNNNSPSGYHDADNFNLHDADDNNGDDQYRTFIVSGGDGADSFIDNSGAQLQDHSGNVGVLTVDYSEEQWQHDNVGDSYGDNLNGDETPVADHEPGVIVNMSSSSFSIDGGLATATGQNTGSVASSHALDTYGKIDSFGGSTGVHSFRLTDANDYFTANGSGAQYSVEGHDGDDTLIGGTGRDKLRGDDGNDSLVGGGGRDDLDGGNGNDTLIGSSGTPNPNDSNDIQGSWFNGGRGNDSMVGNNGGDYFVGGSGHDIITGGDGGDQIAYENDNNDEGHGGLPHEHDGVTATFTSGQGNGTITGHYGSTWVLADPEDPDSGAWVADDVNSTFTSIEGFRGTTGDDSIVIQAGSDPGDDTNTFQLKVEDVDPNSGGHNEDFRAYRVSGGDGNDTISSSDTANHGAVIVDYNDEQWMHDNVGEQYGDGEDGNGDPATENGVVINLSGGGIDTADNGIATATHQSEVTVAAGTALDTYGSTDTLDGVHAFRLTDTNDYFTAAGTGEQYNIEANDGNDTIIGGTARDWLHGGGGDDVINGGGSADDLDGGDGDDTLIAGAGLFHDNDGDDNDFVQGSWFNGGRGNDSMVGNNGGDYFVLGSGHDTIIGGASQDQISWERNDGDGQNHTADFMAVTFDNNTDANGDFTPDGAASGTITGSSGAVAVDIKFSSIEQIRGTNNADTFTAAANATVDPDSSDNFYLTDPAHPNDDGQRHAIRVVGNAGNDTFTDNTTGFGGILKVDYNDEAYQHDNTGNTYGDDPGENGVIINFSGSNKTVDSTLHTATGQTQGVTITSSHGLDTYGSTDSYAGNIHAFSLTDARDVFYGGAAGYSVNMNGGDDTFVGGAGSDNVDGGDGDDSLSGGGGSNEWLGGGSGNDTLVGGTTGYFNLDGNDGNDSLVGTGGDGWMGGGSGNDTLVAGSGRVDLDGGGGDDTITGGAGSNYISAKGGNASITGGDGANGWDELSFSGSANATSHIAFTVTGAGSGTISGDYVDTDNPDDSGAVSGTFAGIEDAVGSNGADTFLISGSGGGDADGWTRHGASGDDKIFAFVGGAGDDTFTDTTSRAGGSSVVNYSEEQWSHAGFGNNQHVWGSQTGEHGVIVNLTADVKTEGTDFTSDAVDSGGTVAGGTAIDTFGDTDTIVGVQVVALTDADDAFFAGNDAFGYQAYGGLGNDTLVGGTGNDTLESGGGNDKLTGGAGSDVFIITSATGNTTITDFADGADKIDLRGFTGISSSSQFLSPIVDGVGGADITIASGKTVHVTGVLAANLTDADFVFGAITSPTTTVTGTPANDYLLGDGNANKNDSISGLGGDDTLNGLTGTDTLIGGDGNDTYIVDGPGTKKIVEGSGAQSGIDTLISSFNVPTATPLAANVENLTLVGSATIGFGNALNNVIIGNGLANSLSGSDGNDTLNGGDGNDTLVGGKGDDTYIIDGTDTKTITELSTSGSGTDTLISSFNVAVLAANVENLTLAGSAITGVGNGLNNVITGNALDNSLSGGLGNDTLDGGAGTDNLAGGGGNDVYNVDSTGDTITENLNEGTDTVQSSVTFSLATLTNVENLTLTGSANIDGTGDVGNNTITGNSGNNVLDGQVGADSLIGGDGNDTYLVDDAGDKVVETNSIKASGGDDTVYASINYTLTANVENLQLALGGITGTGNTLANVITGGDFGNTLDGGTGADTLNGGAGNDTFIVDNPLDVVSDIGGTDTVLSSITFDISSLAFIENLTLTGSTAAIATGNSGNNTITGNAIANTLIGGGGTDILIGGAGNDTYVVDSSDDVVNESLNGGAGTDLVQSSVTFSLVSAQVVGTVENLTLTGGDDINGTGNGSANVIIGNSGANTLDGGDGNDLLVGNAGADTLLGGIGNDTLLGGDQNDSLDGGDGNDSLVGGNGDDTLRSGAGTDALVGGDGNDTYILDGAGTKTITETATGGTADEVVSSITYTLGANIENLTLAAGAGNINGTGNSAANLITGNEGNNVLDGVANTGTSAALADTLVGGDGDDTYVIRNSNDGIIEGDGANSGNDLVQFAGKVAGDTYQIGDNIERLTLTGTLAVNGTGGDGDNTIIGNGAANTLIGGDGNDSLVGGAGNDRLEGGADNDTLDGGTGTDTMLGGDGDDTYIVDSQGEATLIVDSSGIDTVSSIVALNISTLASIENVVMTGSGTGTITGNGEDNSLVGSSGNNTLIGGAGEDTLDGGVGNDSLSGGDDNDTLIGGAGNDTLDGGAGIDSLVGGDGADTYIISDSDDVIVEQAGATAGIDTVISSVNYDLSTNADNVENLTLTGSDNLNGTGNGDANTITGNTGNNSLSGGDGNDSLVGNAGNDTLDGGTGANTLVGGTGDDYYIVGSTADKITEATGTAGGNDTVEASVSYNLNTNAANVENLVLATGAGSISGTGNASVNHITGNEADNTLDGGAGTDIMTGGDGNDTYIVDSFAEGALITELANEGNDTVRFTGVAGNTFVLGNNLENLILLGTAAVNGTGNSDANVITGNSGVNSLVGGGGADILVGLGGNDIYVVDSADDQVDETGGSGTDLVQSSVTFSLASPQVIGGTVENLTLTGHAAINATGNSVGNVINGNDASNIIDGGGGNDTMSGGAGNDTYIVDSTGDVVTETAGQGTDTVLASVTYTLSNANVENLTLTGNSAINGTGNAGNNVIIGNSSTNTLHGMAGNDTLVGGNGDTLVGGAGNDTYVVGSTGTVTINETADLGAGTDTVQAARTFDLGTGANVIGQVENLILTGTGDFDGTGNGLGNLIIGNSGANVLTGMVGDDTLMGGGGADKLVGGTGHDVLFGGAGADVFDFNAADFAGGVANNTDDIFDYSGAGGEGDVIDLDGLIGDYVHDADHVGDFVYGQVSGNDIVIFVNETAVNGNPTGPVDWSTAFIIHDVSDPTSVQFKFGDGALENHTWTLSPDGDTLKFTA